MNKKKTTGTAGTDNPLAELQARWNKLPAEKRQSIKQVATSYGIICAVALIGSLLFVFGGSDNKSADNTAPASSQQETATDTTAETASEEQTTTPAAEQPVDEYLKQRVKQYAVDGDGFADAIREVRVIPEDFGDGSNAVNVEFYVESRTEKRFLDQTIGVIYYALYSSGKNVGAVTVMATTDLVDQYGNDLEGVIYQTTISKADADRVNMSQDEAVLEMQVYPRLWTVQKQHSSVK